MPSSPASHSLHEGDQTLRTVADDLAEVLEIHAEEDFRLASLRDYRVSDKMLWTTTGPTKGKFATRVAYTDPLVVLSRLTHQNQ